MSDLLLGIIAASVATMAVVQVGIMVVAMRTARRVGEAVTRFEADVRPIVTNLKSMSVDAARTASIASVQAQRAEQLVNDVTARVDQAVATLQATLITPAREAYAILQGLLAAFAAFRQGPAPSASRSPAPEEDDSLFIG